MTGNREWDAQWRHIVSELRRSRRAADLSLAEAQRLFDAAPDLSLPPRFAQSVVSLAVYRQGERLQRCSSRWLGHLVTAAVTCAELDGLWREPPCVVGVHGGVLETESVTVVRSDDVDTARLTWAGPAGDVMRWDLSTTEVVVYDVSVDCDAGWRAAYPAVRRGTVLADAFLDGRELDARELGFLQEVLWCDGTDRDWESMARIRDN